MDSTAPRPASAQEKRLPSDAIRGWISLFLILHLFAIGIAISSYARASLVQRRLVGTLQLYLRTFNFDLTHVYPAVARLHLTHAGPTDIDFRINGNAKAPGGKPESWQLPRTGLFPPIRTLRDQTLANVMGGLMESENEEHESLLPRAVAGAEMKRLGAKSGTITVTAHYLLELDDLKAIEPSRNDPFDESYFRPVFDAKVIAKPTGGVDLLKSVAKGEVAPVTGAGGANKSEPVNKE